MKKKLLLGLTCLLSVFLLTGCFTKKEITTNEFKEKVSSLEYEIYDISDQYKEYDFIKEATVAKNSDKNYQIEFYVLETEKKAKSMFETNKELFIQEHNSGTKMQVTTNMLNYSTYKMIANDDYMYLCRVKSTLLYINVEKEYQKEVEELIKKIGY